MYPCVCQLLRETQTSECLGSVCSAGFETEIAVAVVPCSFSADAVVLRQVFSWSCDRHQVCVSEHVVNRPRGNMQTPYALSALLWGKSEEFSVVKCV